MRGSIFTCLIFAFGFTGAVADAQEVRGCGNLSNAFGPYDYRDPDARGYPLHIVEGAHFTPEVEALQKGHTGYLVGDLDYTLRAFPNHHRALNAISRYALLGGRGWTNPSVRSADCYFERAVAFRPDDETVHLLYANYLAKRGDVEGATKHYEEALRIAPSAPEVAYDAGLFFFKQGDMARAKDLARIAYAGGYPLPGLKNMIAEAESKNKQ